jgi:hypothetical protein
VDDELYDKIRVIADKNKRSLSGQLELLIEQCIDAFGEGKWDDWSEKRRLTKTFFFRCMISLQPQFQYC